mgnify:CR=1 FL=1
MASAKPPSLKMTNSLFKNQFMMSEECHTHLITILMEAQIHTIIDMETGEDSSALAQRPFFGSAKQQDMERSLTSMSTAQKHGDWKLPRAIRWDLQSKAI